MSLIVRFSEYTRYDITQDCEVVRFMGSTLTGSYHTELVCPTSRHLRENRTKFKEKVIDLMESGKSPQEISLA